MRSDLLHGRREREINEECRSTARLTLDTNGAMVGFNNLLADVQSESQTAILLCRHVPFKPAEEIDPDLFKGRFR